MIWAEGVFNFRERMIRSYVRMLRCRKGVREDEVEEFNGKRVMERRTDEEGHL